MINELTKVNQNLQQGIAHLLVVNTPNTVTIHGKKGKIVSFFVPDDNPSEMQPVNHF